VPAKATQFLDTLMAQYIGDDLRAKDRTGRKTLAFLNQEIEKLAGQRRQSAEALATFRATRGVLDVAAQSSTGIQRMSSLETDRALVATRRKADWTTLADFTAAVERIVGGLERKNRLLNPKEREAVAFHEMGHALVALAQVGSDPVHKVSIIPRGIGALGYTIQRPTEDRYLLRKSELLDRLDVFLGGRVAEELVFGDVSTGAQNDLQQASDMARHMVTHYDMSEALGLATYDTRPAALYLDGPARPEQCNCSERTAEVIDSEVRRLLDEARERVSITLTAHRATLEALAAELLEKEVVDRKMLDDLLRATLPAPPAAAVPGTAANTNTNASEVTP